MRRPLIVSSDCKAMQGIERLLSGQTSSAGGTPSTEERPDDPARLHLAIKHHEDVIRGSKEALLAYKLAKNTKMTTQKEQDLKQAKRKLEGESE